MANYAHGLPDNPEYNGCSSIWQFFNEDGKDRNRNCGQAALATFLTAHKRLSNDLSSMQILEAAYPPNILFGWFGTSKGQIVQACESYDLSMSEVAGEDELKRTLAAEQPVILLFSVSAGRLWGCELPGGHWVVAYGYDDRFIYLTNWGVMPWEEFRGRWRSWIPAGLGMSGRGLTARI